MENRQRLFRCSFAAQWRRRWWSLFLFWFILPFSYYLIFLLWLLFAQLFCLCLFWFTLFFLLSQFIDDSKFGLTLLIFSHIHMRTLSKSCVAWLSRSTAFYKLNTPYGCVLCKMCEYETVSHLWIEFQTFANRPTRRKYSHSECTSVGLSEWARARESTHRWAARA